MSKAEQALKEIRNVIKKNDLKKIEAMHHKKGIGLTGFDHNNKAADIFDKLSNNAKALLGCIYPTEHGDTIGMAIYGDNIELYLKNKTSYVLADKDIINVTTI